MIAMLNAILIYIVNLRKEEFNQGMRIVIQVVIINIL